MKNRVKKRWIFRPIWQVMALLLNVMFFAGCYSQGKPINTLDNISHVSARAFDANDLAWRIANDSEVTELLREINSLSDGDWQPLHGKISSHSLEVVFHSKNTQTPIRVFMLEAGFIVLRQTDSQGSSMYGVGRTWDMQTTPALKKLWCDYVQRSNHKTQSKKVKTCTAQPTE